MESISVYEIYREAYYSFLEKWERENERYRKRLESGKAAPVTKARLEKLDKRVEFLHKALCQMEGVSG